VTLAGAIRWLTHTGREASPSGLKSKQPDLCERSTTFASLRPCVFAFSSSKQPDLYGRSTTKQPDLCGRSTSKMTFLRLYFSDKSREKRIDERCPGSLSNSEYKRTA